VDVLDALFWVTCLVLAAAGAAKLADPAPTGTTLAALGLPGGAATARVVGGVEVVLALAGLAVGGPVVAGAVAAGYAAFAVVVLLARRRGLASCGCFGARSAPPSTVHVLVNVASAVVAAAAAVVGPVPAADGLAAVDGTLLAVVVAGLVLLAASLVVAVDTVVADVVERTAALAD
jgi:hypothetical protein